MREFDLNIERVLENWTVAHALREVIANALDEQALTGTREPEIFRDTDGRWHIRDWGRGLRYEHLTQNENKEKLAYPDKVVGKFGVGLKDALATFDRHRIAVVIRSRYGDITTGKQAKHGFADIKTLHALITEPADPAFVGRSPSPGCCSWWAMPCTRPQTVPVAEATDLVPAVAQALWRQTERATHQGLLSGYILIEESSQVLRGRLRESEQLHRHHGLPLPLEIQHDAKGNENPVRHVVRHSGIEIFCHAADLNQPADELLVQMSDLAERIAATRLQPWPNSLSVNSGVTR